MTGHPSWHPSVCTPDVFLARSPPRCSGSSPLPSKWHRRPNLTRATLKKRIMSQRKEESYVFPSAAIMKWINSLNKLYPFWQNIRAWKRDQITPFPLLVICHNSCFKYLSSVLLVACLVFCSWPAFATSPGFIKPFPSFILMDYCAFLCSSLPCLPVWK